MAQKKQYNAIDLLKFIMALFVVMIHVKPNVHSELLTTLFDPLLSIAVPVFFVISSVLVFSKFNFEKYSELVKYCKRIGLLYLCWLIIDSWYIWENKSYFSMGYIGLVEFIKDLIFATTFPGSWYLSASVMGVIFVYSLNKLFHPIVVFLLLLLLRFYFFKIESFPTSLQGPYEWYVKYLRKEVTLSFPAQMIWISIGQLLSIFMSKIEKRKELLFPCFCITFIFAYILGIYYSGLEIRIFMVVSLVCICFLIELPSNPIYVKIRNYSILMFFFHFSIAGKKVLFCSFIGKDTLITNWIYYFIVIIVSIAFAEIVLRLEKNKYLSFLKYMH